MPTTPPPIEDPATQRHRAHLDEMIELGVTITRMIHKQIAAQAEAAHDNPAATIAPSLPQNFDIITRSVRKSMLLFRDLGAQAPAAQHRTQARQSVIRAVEDTIHRQAPEHEAASLHRELLDRLDTPDFDEDLAARPIAELITEICRDLGLEAHLGTDPWLRRTPADIATLKARAAAHPGDRQASAEIRPQPKLHRIRSP